jgi:hypothetical protein
VAAVYITEENKCSIDILDVPGGRLIRRYPVPGYDQAITPNWSPDATRIIFTLLTKDGETLATLDTATGNIRHLLRPSFNEFTGPAFFFSHYIIFSVDHSGAENIYAMDTVTRAIFKVTSGRFATYDPDFTSDKRTMICSDYTADGLMVGEISFDTASWLPLAKVEDYSCKLYNVLASQESANIQDSVRKRNIYKMNSSDHYDFEKDSISGTLYPTKKYSKALNLFNPHSWAPVSFNVNNLTFRPGVMLLSQNTLSTMIASAGWEYNYNEQTGKFYTNISYQGWYPSLSIMFNIGNRAGYAHYHGSSEAYRFTWQETNLRLLASIPWNFSHGRYDRNLQPSVGTTLIGLRHDASTPSKFTSGLIQTMDYNLTASQYQRSNAKDVYPRFGQSVDINYHNSPFGSNNMGSIFASELNLYFPGIIRHHGIRIYGGWQQRHEEDVLSYSYSNIIRYPRGYTGRYDDNLLSVNLNYKLPLWYPDFSLGSVIYLKRLKLNLFYDWANGMNTGYVNTYQSLGGELTADFHLLRFIVPIEMGLRSLYYPSTGGWGFQLVYSISY